MLLMFGAVVLLVGVLCVVVWCIGGGSSAPKTLSSINETVALALIDVKQLSADTKRFRLALPSANHTLGLPVGQHISLKYTDENNGKMVSRSYTPVTSDDTLGHVDLVVKVYFKTERFPEGGKMSQHLNDMAIGETINVSGPKGKLTYAGCGEIQIKHRPRDTESEIRQAIKIGMIAGGTGITPMLQVIRQALKDPKDKTEFSIIFANQTENDILLRDELDEMSSKNDNVNVWYTVDRVVEDKNWKYSTGYVNAEMIKDHLPAPSNGTQIFMCGPPPMMKFAVLPALESLGYSPDMHFAF